MRGHHRQRLGEKPDHAVEPDPGEAVARLDLEPRIDHEHDVDVARHDGTGELGVPALQADIDRPDEVSVGEVLGCSAVDRDRAVFFAPRDLFFLWLFLLLGLLLLLGLFALMFSRVILDRRGGRFFAQARSSSPSP